MIDEYTNLQTPSDGRANLNPMMLNPNQDSTNNDLSRTQFIDKTFAKLPIESTQDAKDSQVPDSWTKDSWSYNREDKEYIDLSSDSDDIVIDPQGGKTHQELSNLTKAHQNAKNFFSAFTNPIASKISTVITNLNTNMEQVKEIKRMKKLNDELDRRNKLRDQLTQIEESPKIFEGKIINPRNEIEIDLDDDCFVDNIYDLHDAHPEFGWTPNFIETLNTYVPKLFPLYTSRVYHTQNLMLSSDKFLPDYNAIMAAKMLKAQRKEILPIIDLPKISFPCLHCKCDIDEYEGYCKLCATTIKEEIEYYGEEFDEMWHPNPDCEYCDFGDYENEPYFCDVCNEDLVEYDAYWNGEITMLPPPPPKVELPNISDSDLFSDISNDPIITDESSRATDTSNEPMDIEDSDKTIDSSTALNDTDSVISSSSSSSGVSVKSFKSEFHRSGPKRRGSNQCNNNPKKKKFSFNGHAKVASQVVKDKKAKGTYKDKKINVTRANKDAKLLSQAYHLMRDQEYADLKGKQEACEIEFEKIRHPEPTSEFYANYVSERTYYYDALLQKKRELKAKEYDINEMALNSRLLTMIRDWTTNNIGSAFIESNIWNELDRIEKFIQTSVLAKEDVNKIVNSLRVQVEMKPALMDKLSNFLQKLITTVKPVAWGADAIHDIYLQSIVPKEETTIELLDPISMENYCLANQKFIDVRDDHARRGDLIHKDALLHHAHVTHISRGLLSHTSNIDVTISMELLFQLMSPSVCMMNTSPDVVEAKMHHVAANIHTINLPKFTTFTETMTVVDATLLVAKSLYLTRRRVLTAMGFYNPLR